PSRSEVDVSGPGSEHSDDALSLRSRSVPGFNGTVSSISAPPTAESHTHTHTHTHTSG
ncbi:unnamed protein product, partial [Tetraodon nigroviridis]